MIAQLCTTVTHSTRNPYCCCCSPLHLLPDSFDDIDDVKSKWIDMFFGCVIRTCGKMKIPTTINISVNGRNSNVVVLVDKAVYVSPTLHADYHKMNMLCTVLASHLAHQDTECTYMLRREPKANARHHKLHYISLSLFFSLLTSSFQNRMYPNIYPNMVHNNDR